MNMDNILQNIHRFDLDVEAIKKEAGRRLRRIREGAEGRTQEALKSELEENGYPSITTRTIRRWENNGMPLNRIEKIARCLGHKIQDFFATEVLEKLNMSPSKIEFSKSNPANTVASDINTSDTSTSETVTLNPTAETQSAKRVNWPVICLITVIVGVLGLAIFWYAWVDKPALHIDWPQRWIETNIIDVSGKIKNLSAGELQDLEIRLFVHPVDGDVKYWLNTRDPATLMADGKWYQRCRFGDEDVRTMKKPPPIDFEVYAVAMRKGIDYPLQEGPNHILAVDETTFRRAVSEFSVMVSPKFTITRVAPSTPMLPVVLSMKPPIRLTWQEQGPMYIQVYHGGEVIRDGFFNPGDSIDLTPSTILYEIKMSREKGYPQSSVWVMVETM